MNINEIEQILKNIPNELYEIPQYGRLLSNIHAYKHSRFVSLCITLPTGSTIISVNVFDDMEFTFRIYKDEYETIEYSKMPIKDIADKFKSYLTILGFNCITL